MVGGVPWRCHKEDAEAEGEEVVYKPAEWEPKVKTFAGVQRQDDAESGRRRSRQAGQGEGT